MQQQLKKLYQQTKKCLRISVKNPNKSIEHLKVIQKQLKQIKFHLSYQQEQQKEQKQSIANLQIIILNNLACSYNEKGKHKASLFNLELVRQLQRDMFTKNMKVDPHCKSQDQAYMAHLKDKPEILHQIATTHSNICATYSQMGNHDKAILQIQKAISFLECNEQAKKSDALAVFYYNYAIQLEHLGRINDAHKKASKALSLSTSKPEIRVKIEETIQKLEEKMKKRQKKIGEYLASKYRSPFFDQNNSNQLNRNNQLSTQYISITNQSKRIDKSLSAYTTKLPNSLKKMPKSTQYPNIQLPRKFRKSKNRSPMQSNTLVVESRRKIQSLYDTKYEIPEKTRFSLNRRRQNLHSLLKSIHE